MHWGRRSSPPRDRSYALLDYDRAPIEDDLATEAIAMATLAFALCARALPDIALGLVGAAHALRRIPLTNPDLFDAINAVNYQFVIPLIGRC
jgi:hypothetical protein